MSRVPPSIAATSTVAMVRTAMARGVDVSDVLGDAGLTLASLEDPDARIPAPTVLRIWNTLRERTGDPLLQLAAPATLPFGAYRVIEYLVAASATVGDGFRRFAEYFGLIADALLISIAGEGDEYSFTLATADGGAVPPVYADYVFAALVIRIRMRIYPGLCASRVELRQPEPDNAAPYIDVFRAPVRFGAAHDRMWFTAATWNAPTLSADDALVHLIEEHARILAQRLPRLTPAFTRTVEKAIVSTLPDGGSVDSVARSLNVSVRTLQRKLVESGTTFREVLDAVRHQLAEGYLVDPGVSIAEVTFLLGFSEESAFNRAFRRWTGEAPGRWRQRQMRTH